jgi:Fe-S-cluster containining protein
VRDWDEESADRALVAAVDAAVAAAECAAGPRLVYSGCPACCIGPFPINEPDARRLIRGVAALAASDPARAQAVRRRAAAAVARLAADFPGDAATGTLTDDDGAQDRFCRAHSDLPCPALDPRSGRCDVYDWRPLSCRTFGPPVRIGGEDLPPCERCFKGGPAEADACRVTADPDGLEEALLDAIEARGGSSGETLVAFALLRRPL